MRRSIFIDTICDNHETICYVSNLGIKFVAFWRVRRTRSPWIVTEEPARDAGRLAVQRRLDRLCGSRACWRAMDRIRNSFCHFYKRRSHVARKGIVEEKIRFFRSECFRVSSILRIVARASPKNSQKS